MLVQPEVLLTNMVIRFAVGAFLIRLKKITDNMMMKSKFFGLVVPVFLFGKKFIEN